MACVNLSGVYWAGIPRHDEYSHLTILIKGAASQSQFLFQDHRQADWPFISSVVQLSQNLMVKHGAALRGQAFSASGSVLYCEC